MSNDFISRSALIEKATGNDIYGMVDIRDIEEIPTAYDVDKVVEQLKNMYIPIVEDLGDTSYELVRKREAIDIVKVGGVNEN